MHDFNWFTYLFAKFGIPVHLASDDLYFLTAILVAVLLMIAAVVTYPKVRNTEKALIPTGRMTLQNILEVTVGSLMRLMEDLIGNKEKAAKFLPIIIALFIFIFTCNAIGLIPGFLPPTSNVYINFGCAISVFVYYNYVGFREHGIKYIKHFMGPVFWLAPIMLPIELVSNLVRPVSLSIRLYGNMMGDHMVLGVFSSIVPLVVPIVFMFLGLFIVFIQAFVFSLLSAMYIALAVEH